MGVLGTGVGPNRNFLRPTLTDRKSPLEHFNSKKGNLGDQIRELGTISSRAAI